MCLVESRINFASVTRSTYYKDRRCRIDGGLTSVQIEFAFLRLDGSGGCPRGHKNACYLHLSNLIRTLHTPSHSWGENPRHCCVGWWRIGRGR